MTKPSGAHTGTMQATEQSCSPDFMPLVGWSPMHGPCKFPPRRADAQGTASIPTKKAGVRCDSPAPLRVAPGRAQPEPKHRFGRWRRPATGCGAGVSNNQRCRTTSAVEQRNSAWRAGGPARASAGGPARASAGGPHRMPARRPGSPYRQEICSIRAAEICSPEY